MPNPSGGDLRSIRRYHAVLWSGASTDFTRRHWCECCGRPWSSTTGRPSAQIG